MSPVVFLKSLCVETVIEKGIEKKTDHNILSSAFISRSAKTGKCTILDTNFTMWYSKNEFLKINPS